MTAKDQQTAPSSACLAWRFRQLGILPLLFFLAHAFFYWRTGGLSNILWMCNIGNLLLAAGLLLAQPILVRVAVIWLIPGLFIWLCFVVLPGEWRLTSGIAHIGGLLVELVAMARVRASPRTWLYGLGWYLLVQQVCRLFTPAELNVNVAHQVYAGWEQVVSAYWQYWLSTTLMVAAGLWVTGIILLKLWPPSVSLPGLAPGYGGLLKRGHQSGQPEK